MFNIHHINRFYGSNKNNIIGSRFSNLWQIIIYYKSGPGILILRIKFVISVFVFFVIFQ